MTHGRMTRRRFLQLSAATATAAATAPHLLGQSASTRPRRPNVILLMDDQHRGDAMGIAGDDTVLTPNLDRLAREGAYFPRGYSSVPSCCPARACLLTGMSPWGCGMLGYAPQAKQWPIMKPQSLRDAGYNAASFGKNHFQPMRNAHGYDPEILYDGTGKSDGVDDYGLWLKKVAPGVNEHATGLGWNERNGKPWPFKDELHPTDWTAQEAINYLNAYQSDKPFYVKISFHRPHSPWDPVQHWFDHYHNKPVKKAVVGPWSQKLYGSFVPPRAKDAPRAALSEAAAQACKQPYYGSISHVDEQIGRVMDTLRQRNLLEDTFIIFVSDHGEMAGDHNLWRKTYAYEGSAHIPYIVRWGENVMTAKRGQILPQLVELRDVLPTFLDVASAPIPKAIEGKSLLPLLHGRTDGWRTQLDLEHATCYFKENCWNALTDGKTKYIYFAFDGTEQLFDLTNDPGECNDLSASPPHAAAMKDWRAKMIQHLRIRGQDWVKNDDLVIRPKTSDFGANFPRTKNSATTPSEPSGSAAGD